MAKAITVVRPYALEKSEMWKIISEPGNLENFHPFCKSNIPILWCGEGSVDEVTYLNERVFKREFHNWFEGDGYDLSFIGEKTMAEVSWRIINDNEACSVGITIVPCFMPFSTLLLRPIVRLYIHNKLESYLHSVLKGLEYFAINRQKVSPNQFGKNSWFS